MNRGVVTALFIAFILVTSIGFVSAQEESQTIIDRIVDFFRGLFAPEVKLAPAVITDCTSLQNMNNNLGGGYYLTGDVDCSDTVNWNAGRGFIPIGDSTKRFTGSFNGGNYKITNLYINDPNLNYAGLFGYVDSSTSKIQSVGLENVSVTAKNYVGGVVGFMRGGATIEVVYSTGKVNGLSYLGGLVGRMFLGTIQASYSEADVTHTGPTAGSNIGGLVGDAYRDSVIRDSYSTGKVVGEVHTTGGIAGRVYDATLKNSYSTGNVSSAGLYEGGLVGDLDWGTQMSNTFTVGVTQNIGTNAGGLVGRKRDSDTETTIVNNSYYIGFNNVNVGVKENNPDVFKDQGHSVYTNWDFFNKWSICPGEFPKLQWQEGACLPIICGDGRVESGENCDDGNLVNGDGCDSSCRIDPGWRCFDISPSICIPIVASCLIDSDCGETLVNAVCDSETSVSTTIITPSCVDSSCVYTFSSIGSTCPFGICSEGSCVAVCGDGIKETGEQCDDGKHCNGESTASCTQDSECYFATSQGDDQCLPRSGDGCSSTCQIEPTLACTDTDGTIDSKTINEGTSKFIAGLQVFVNESDESQATGTISSAVIVSKPTHMFLSSDGKLRQGIAYDEGVYTIELVAATDTSATVRVTDPQSISDSKEVNEGSSKVISGLEIAVDSADESTGLGIISAGVTVDKEIPPIFLSVPGNPFSNVILNGTEYVIGLVAASDFGAIIRVNSQRNYYVQGNITLIREDLEVFTYGDFCAGDILVEHTCESASINLQSCPEGCNINTQYTCPNGCSNGACVSTQCIFTSALWDRETILEGEEVTLTVTGENCDGKSVSFSIYEEDGINEGLTNDNIAMVFATTVFSGGIANVQWTAVFHNDCGGSCLPSEHYFIAWLTGVGIPNIRSSNYLDVAEAAGVCGDGNLDPGEQCDDGNVINGDGCSDSCLIEQACTTDADCPSTTERFCSEAGEACFSSTFVSCSISGFCGGGGSGGGGCTPVCPNGCFEGACITICGNGVLEAGEQCDDGNLLDGDGCSSTCIATCGNGVLDPGEQCDDGNIGSGDGCSNSCEIEQACTTDADCPSTSERFCSEAGEACSSTISYTCSINNYCRVFGGGFGCSPVCPNGCLDGYCIADVLSNSESIALFGGAESFNRFPLFGGTKIYLNDPLNKVKTTITKAQLPLLLADDNFNGNVNADYIQKIIIGSDPIVIFAKQPTPNVDPVIGLKLSTQPSNYIYNLSVTFAQAVDFTHPSSIGREIILFGVDYAVSSLTTSTKLVLLKSSQTFTLNIRNSNSNPSEIVIVEGETYTVELVAGSDSDATIRVTDSSGGSDSKTIAESASKKIQGLEVAVNTADESSLESVGITSEISVGSNILSLTNGQEVREGSFENAIDNTNVGLIGGITATTRISIEVAAQEVDADYISVGDYYLDPIFKTFRLEFAGLNADAGEFFREEIDIRNTGVSGMTVSFIDYNRDSISNFKWVYNKTDSPGGGMQLANDKDDLIHVVENEVINKSEYVMVGNEDDGGLYQITTLTNSSSEFKLTMTDVFTLNSVTVTDSTGSGIGTITLKGQDYIYTFIDASTSAARQIRLNYPDSAGNDLILFPTIETSKGANFAFYEPIYFLEIEDDTKILIPDGDGYAEVNVGNHSLGNFNFQVSELDFSVDRYDILGDPFIDVVLKDVSGNQINRPAIIIFEEGDNDNKLYEAIIVELDSGYDGDSAGIGISDVERTWSSDSQWDDIQLATDNDIYQEMDLWGSLITVDKSDPDQATAVISYPGDQIYAQLYISSLLGGELSCAEGCKFQNRCIPYGIRVAIGTGKTPLYCDVDGELRIQKFADSICEDDHECISKVCTDNRCVGGPTSPSPPSTTTSSEGGGGGSSSGGGGTISDIDPVLVIWTETIIADDFQLGTVEGFNVDLSGGKKLDLTIRGETHSIGVLSVTLTTAKILVFSEPQEAVLIVGETRKFEVNGDNRYDLKVTLNSIENGEASFSVSSIDEQILSDFEEQQQLANSNSENIFLREKIISKAEILLDSSTKFIILTMILIIAILIGVSIAYFRKLKK